MPETKPDEQRIRELPDYIECDGVRVPFDWTIYDLREALAKRKLTFRNQSEIEKAFSYAINMKQALSQQVVNLEKQRSELERITSRLKSRLNIQCPSCRTFIDVGKVLEKT